MSIQRITATSDEESPEDERLLGILRDRILEQNQSMIDVAQKMLTITFSGIGVVLAIQEKWFTASTQSSLSKTLVLTALVTLLGSVPIYLYVIKAKLLAATRNDFGMIEDELVDLAKLRRRGTSLGMTMTGLATLLLILATAQ